MGLRSWIRDRALGQEGREALSLAQAWLREAPVDIEPTTSALLGPSTTHQPPIEILLRESKNTAAACQRAIANRAATVLEPQAKVRKILRPGTAIDEIIDDHPMTQLLQRPHPNLMWRLILRPAVQGLVDGGEWYWQKIYDRLPGGLRSVRRLYPVPPTMVEPRVKSNEVIGYTVTDAMGNRKPYPVDEFIRLWFPDPEQPWRSEGYLGPSGTVVEAHKFVLQTLRAHFEHNSIPPVFFEAQGDAEAIKPNSPEQRRFYTLLRQMFNRRTGTQVGAGYLLPRGWKANALRTQTGIELTPLLEYLRDEICQAYGVPKAILGLVVSGDRSAAEVLQYVFDLHTIMPIANIVADLITLQLAGDYATPGLFFGFENFVAPDKEFELKREQHDLEHAIRSPNMVRTDRGWEEVPWGKKPTALGKFSAYDPNAKPQPAGPQGIPGAPPPGRDDAKLSIYELRAEEKRAHAEIRTYYRGLMRRALGRAEGEAIQ